MAAHGRFAARGRGRGAVAELVDEPPQAEVPCDQTAEFFGSLLPRNWPLFLTVTPRSFRFSGLFIVLSCYEFTLGE